MRAVFLLPVFAAILCMTDDDGNASLLPEGPGKELVSRACTECHSVDRMRTFRIGKDEWLDKIADMVDRGAKATDAESDAMAEYLVRNFGTDSKVWVNTAPMIEMRAVLGFTLAEGNAVVAYRTSKGNFKQWGDLLKVPGLDAAKVEAKKDLMTF